MFHGVSLLRTVSVFSLPTKNIVSFKYTTKNSEILKTRSRKLTWNPICSFSTTSQVGNSNLNKEQEYSNKITKRMNNRGGNIVWVDLEMSGLDIDKDVILEMACIITDKDLNIIAEVICTGLCNSILTSERAPKLLSSIPTQFWKT